MRNRRLWTAWIATILAAGWLALHGAGRAADAPADPAKEGFASIFNGKDLAGWKGDPDLWSVSNGEIVGSTDKTKLKHNSFLATEKSYGDFVLRASFKLRNHNSGIQFRSELLPEYVVKGYQADMADKEYTGMLYEEGKRGILDYWKKMSAEEHAKVFAAFKPGEWNTYEITCKGHHLKMLLNGQTTLDFDDPDGSTSGIIALQLHMGPGMQVNFKDLWIKELK